MNDATIIAFAGRDTLSDPLTDLLRKGARELLQTAVEAELDAFLTDERQPRCPAPTTIVAAEEEGFGGVLAAADR